MRRANTLLFLAALSVAALGQTAQAIVWNGSFDTDFTNGANWDGGVAPADGSSDVAEFNGTPTANQPSLAGPYSIGGINFGTSGWTIGGAGTLTVTNTSNNSSIGPIMCLNTSGTNTISVAGLVANGSTNFGLTIPFPASSSDTLAISSVISGVNGINQNGSGVGTIILSGLNTYTGHTWIQRGTMVVNTLADYGNASSLGAESDSGISEIYMGGSSSPTLRYTGSGGSTNRMIELGGSSSATYSFVSDGTGPIAFTGSFIATTTTATLRTIALRGTNTGANAINGVIADSIGNGVASPPYATFGITKSEAGKWILNGNNTYTGPTTVNGGTLVLNGTGAYTAATTINGAGAALVLGANGAIGSGNALTVTNGSVDIASFNQTAAAVTLTAGSITGTSGVLTGTSFAVNNNTGTTTISANLAGGGNLTKSLAGILVLSGASTYTGKTTVSGGELQYNSIANVGGGASALGAPTTVANGTIDVGATSGTTLTYTGPTASTDRVINLAGTASLFLASSGTGPLTFTSSPTVSGTAGARRFALRGTNTGDNTISAIIADGGASSPFRVDKLGVGKWVLTGLNTFSGSSGTTPSMVVAEGTLEFNSVANVGVASALGKPADASTGRILLGSLTVGGGSTTGANMVYTGSGHSTDRVLELAGATTPVAIYANGSGPLTFTSALTATGAGVKTLTLRGTNTGDNTIGGAIVDNSGVNTTSLTKDDAGKWVLGGANTYTGATTVTAGTLTVSGASAKLGTGNVTVQGSNAGTNLTIASGVANAIGDTATLNLLGGGTVGTADQGYANLGAGISEKVGVLQLNSVAQATGLTYGSTGSPAAIKSNEYFAGTGVVSVGLPGDFNGNNSVDAADYVRWRKSTSTFGGTAGYNLWRANFGNTFPSSVSGLSSNGGVPEPCSLVLFFLAVVGLTIVHRNRRQSG